MNRTIRVGLNFHTSISKVDPTALKTAYDVNLIRNLYGRLVESDSEGQLIADLPESFSSIGNEIIFVFGNKTRTVDGTLITAKDAELSIKRTLMKDKIGHGDLKRFLCVKRVLHSLDDICEDIRSDGNKLFLKVEKPSFIPFVLGLLQSPDYSIIPSEAIDMSNPKLEIKSFRATSGPYYVEADSAVGALTFKANKNSHHYNPEMPQEVNFVPVGIVDGQAKFLSNEIDLLPTLQAFSGPEGKEIIESGKFEIHETLPFKVSIISFSRKLMNESSPSQRMKTAAVVAKGMDSILPILGAVPATQFFQPLGEGSLNPAQLEQLNGLKNSKSPPLRTLEITVGKSFLPLFEREFANTPELKVTLGSIAPILMPEDEKPDVYYFSTDSAWSESISLIGYNIEMGLFKLPGVDMDSWFQEYINLESRDARLEKLNSLHFEMLRTASFVPYRVSPYYAAVKKPWKLNQSRLVAGTSLWQMRKN